MSNLFRSTTIKGTRITDFSQTAARVGDPIPFGYGTFPVDGNVIWAPLPPKEHVSKKRQGKGGVKQETFTYTLSYAIAFCRGPISRYLWIKRNGKVVYTTDPAAPIEDQAYAAKWAEKATFYMGTTGQLPDSTIESYEGVGSVSAFRRGAYIVVEDDDVTEGGGAVPTYEACVVTKGRLYLTTPCYGFIAIDHLESAGNVYGMYDFNNFVDHFDEVSTVTGGQFRDILQVYPDNPPDEFDTTATVLSGELKTPLVQYRDNPPDEFDTTATVLSGTLKNVLIQYGNNPPDEFDTTATITGGTLS